MHVNCISVASLWALLCDIKMFTIIKSPPDCGMDSVIRLWTQEMVCLLTCIARFVMPMGLLQWVTEREIGWRGSRKAVKRSGQPPFITNDFVTVVNDKVSEDRWFKIKGSWSIFWVGCSWSPTPTVQTLFYKQHPPFSVLQE